MNFIRHNFSEESKDDLLQFLKVAKEVRAGNAFCDEDEYEKLKHVFPLDEKLKSELKSHIENNPICIDITQSEDEGSQEKQDIDSKKISEELSQLFTQSSFNQSNFNTEDIVYAIKENLDTRKKLPMMVLENLNELSNKKLEAVFQILGQELGLESVQNFWFSMQDATHINNSVASSYVRLFLEKIKTEFCDEVKDIFCNLSTKHSSLLKKELARELLENVSVSEEQRVLFQYLGTLNNDFKSNLLREFVEHCGKLQTQHIPSVDVLLHNQTNHDLLSKLVELMSHSAADFANDKPFGKMLLKIVKSLGKNVSQLEQPLKHILGLHKSIWKKEVEKYVVSNFDDTMTQF